MCVIAGYIGTERAAPILIEMLRREEGLAGAFNTGIATIHEGRLYWKKVVGDVKVLEQETGARDLPGTIGIIHSRIPGGEWAWAHPFLDDGEKMVYIANGAMGKYEDIPQLTKRFQSLKANGHHFPSEQTEAVEHYKSLENGKTWVHFSEIKVKSIAEQYQAEKEETNRLREAVGKDFEEYPSEIVGLALHADHPDEIVVARINKPMKLAGDANGALYLASASLALPEEVLWQNDIAPDSVNRIHRSGEISMRPLNRTNLIPIGKRPSAEELEKALLQPLREQGERNMEQMFADAAALYPATHLTEKETVVFDLLQALLHEGRIELFNKDREGVRKGSMIPWTYVRWKG